MTKVLVLYHSMYGHVETMADAVAEGARSIDGVEVTIKRVPETMDKERFQEVGGKVDQKAPVAEPDELREYDAIIFGTPTRFGNMSGQMRNFLDRTGGLWAKGALAGKVASVFTSTGTGGGQEMTITSCWTTLAHHAMIIGVDVLEHAGQGNGFVFSRVTQLLVKMGAVIDGPLADIAVP